MENPPLYRKKSISEIENRQTYELTDLERTQVTQTINKFFELFKVKHL